VDPQVVEYLAQVTPGLPVAQVIDWLAQRTRVEQVREAWGPAPEDVDAYIYVPLYDVKLLPGGDEVPPDQIESVAYGPAFPGVVNDVRMGMTGDEVERVLGSPDRLWPMPHENYVLLYDHPRFLRVDLDRRTEQVIAIIR